VSAISQFETILESVEQLPEEDQEVLVDLVQQRLAERRRRAIARNIVEAREEYKSDQVRRGSVDDLLAEMKD
jgi:predicted ATPase